MLHVESIVVQGPNGIQVPCHILWPVKAEFPLPFIIATHGATSSKHEWTEFDGYTKGGNLAQEYLAHGIAVIAMDWHYHGDNDTQDMHGKNVFSDEHFDDFFNRSVSDAQTVIAFAQQDSRFDSQRMGFSGYSLAGMFGFWLANHGINFKAMVLCVPGVDRQDHKYYSTFNNLDHLQDTAILQVSAQNDEYVRFEEAQWLFEQIPATKKKFISFLSGHSLPVDYVAYASQWMKAELV